MLPSGNDASLALATWAGGKLYEDMEEMIGRGQEERMRFRSKSETSEEWL